MIYQKILHALKTGNALLPVPNVTHTARLETAALMEQAERFDFGPMMLERTGPVVGGDRQYQIPEVTEEETQWWREGLLPSPAPICWYEFSLSNHPSAILALDDGQVLKITRFDWENQSAFFADLWWGSDRAEPQPATHALSVRPVGNFEFLEGMNRVSPDWETSDAMNLGFTVYLTLMLNSKTTERERVKAQSASLAKARGVLPRPEHTIVRITPERFLRDAEVEGNRTHASPRLHWRRSHIRVYDHATPNAKPYKDGKWAVVISRVLVNKADPTGDTVSHHYWVTKSKEQAST